MAKVCISFTFRFFLFKPGITETSSITDLLGELSRRSSAAPTMWVGENSPNVVLLVVGQVRWGNSQVPSKRGILSGLIAHIRKKNSMRLFIYTLMLFDNLGNIWGINQSLFLWRPVGGLQPRCSRWSHCKSNKTENKIWKKGNTLQIQALKPSESRLYSIVCVLAAFWYEKVSEWLALLERCLVAN